MQELVQRPLVELHGVLPLLHHVQPLLQGLHARSFNCC